MKEPEFSDERGSFIVKFYKMAAKNEIETMEDDEIQNLLLFCKTPRTRKEIAEYLGLSSITYADSKVCNAVGGGWKDKNEIFRKNRKVQSS